MKIRIISKSKDKLPGYSTNRAVGMDIRANIDKDIVLKPMGRALVKTRLFVEIPVGYEAQIRQRSGLTFKNGIIIVNSSGTIDNDYREEVCVSRINLFSNNFVIKDGERICQKVIAKQQKAEWSKIDNLIKTE